MRATKFFSAVAGVAVASCLSLTAHAALIGAYDFTGGSLNDSSGNGNHATISEGAHPGSGATFTNGAVVDGARGAVFDLSGGGLGGNGSDGGVNLNLPVAGNNTGSWTLAMWTLNPQGTIGYLFDNRNTAAGTTAGGDRLILNHGQSGQESTSVFDGVAWRNPGTPSIDDGTWHHVAYVYDGTTLTGYVDGVAGTTPVAVAIGRDLLLEDIELGNEGSGGGGGGQEGRLIDNVRVYNNALSASEVAALTVPEPSTICLLTLAGLGFVAARRRC